MPTEGGERAPPGSLLMALCQVMQTGPFLPPSLCIHWLRCGLNLFSTRCFYLPGTRRFYRVPVQPGGVPRACWSPYQSPLLVPPLLRQGSVGVLTSVAVALVIKRTGYTHTASKLVGIAKYLPWRYTTRQSSPGRQPTCYIRWRTCRIRKRPEGSSDRGAVGLGPGE